MSDTSAGPAWWMASDGKWYPPELWTGPPPSAGAAESAGATAIPAPASSGSVPPLPSYAAYPTPYAGPAPYATGASTYPVGVPGAYAYAPARATNGLSTASLICACGGIIPIFFGIPCILGIIFGFVARSQIRRSNGAQQGSGLALAGIIVGFSLIAVFIALLSLAFAFGHVNTCASTTNSCVVN
jgi:Domain of unknown function (DUF4190)